MGILLFLWIVGPVIFSAVPETDLWWMIPTVSHETEGKSLGQSLRFLLGPFPLGFGQPILKLYLLLATSSHGLCIRHLILLSVLFHFGNALLLTRVSRQFGLSRDIAFFSGFMYLTIFPHFHAVLWPTAFQHVLAVFTILLVLHLYLRTEEKFQSGASESGGRIFWAAIMAGLLASLQRSAAILVSVLLLAHILICSRTPLERQAKYDRWLPLFVVFSFYPSLSLAFVGDVIVHQAIAQWSLSPWARFFFLFGAVLASLSLIRFLVYRPMTRPVRRFGIFLLFLGAAALFGSLCLHDKRHLLLPYNVLVPFATTLASYLDPLPTALLIDSTEAFHFIPPQVSFYVLCVSLFLMGMFGAVFVTRHRSLLLLGIWYSIGLVHLLHQYSSFPVFTPSRYFIYITPVFSIVFCAVLVSLGARLLRGTRLVPIFQQRFLFAFLVGLGISNLLAVRLEMHRGRLSNTFLMYEDIRAASLIRGDLVDKANRSGSAVMGPLSVSNVVPMPFKELLDGVFSDVDPARYQNFRLTVNEIFGHRLRPEIRINEPPNNLWSHHGYILNSDRIVDSKGRSIDPFTEFFDEGIAQMKRNRTGEALRLFERAIETKPFLLRYLLTTGRLEDIRWMSNGLDMREWIRRIGEKYFLWGEAPIPKFEHTLSTMHQELSDYILCFVFVSYLKHQQGDFDGSRYALGRIWFLERNPQALVSWITSVPIVREDPGLSAFVQGLKDPWSFCDPIPWRKDDYGFGRFMVRLLFRWDIPSRWSTNPLGTVI